jgi:hypothetical protein
MRKITVAVAAGVMVVVAWFVLSAVMLTMTSATGQASPCTAGGPVLGPPTAQPPEADVVAAFHHAIRTARANRDEQLALWEAGIVESGLRNLHYGDADSQGALQERVSIYGLAHALDPFASAMRFLTDARKLRPWRSTPGMLAAAVQRPREDLRGRYDEVAGQAGKYMRGADGGGGGTVETPEACADPGTAGPANLQRAVQVDAPRRYATLPQWAMSSGRAPEQVDARILPDVLWVLRTYGLRVHAARESGHHTHGDGTALDMGPATGNDQAAWDRSALRLAHDLGWTESCAASGITPVCHLVPAIRFIGYNGYTDGHHGDPAHVGSWAHIHVSWFASVYGNPGLVPPNAWVRVFPVGS